MSRWNDHELDDEGLAFEARLVNVILICGGDGVDCVQGAVAAGLFNW